MKSLFNLSNWFLKYSLFRLMLSILFSYSAMDINRCEYVYSRPKNFLTISLASVTPVEALIFWKPYSTLENFLISLCILSLKNWFKNLWTRSSLRHFFRLLSLMSFAATSAISAYLFMRSSLFLSTSCLNLRSSLNRWRFLSRFKFCCSIPSTTSCNACSAFWVSSLIFCDSSDLEVRVISLLFSYNSIWFILSL